MKLERTQLLRVNNSNTKFKVYGATGLKAGDIIQVGDVSRKIDKVLPQKPQDLDNFVTVIFNEPLRW